MASLPFFILIISCIISTTLGLKCRGDDYALSYPSMDCEPKVKNCWSYELEFSEVPYQLKNDIELFNRSYIRSCEPHNVCSIKALSGHKLKKFTAAEISKIDALRGFTPLDLYGYDFEQDIGTVEELFLAGPKSQDFKKKKKMFIARYLTFHIRCCNTDLCNTWNSANFGKTRRPGRQFVSKSVASSTLHTLIALTFVILFYN